MNIVFIGSPNFTEGRTAPIDHIVIHWMDGTLASTDSVFQDTTRKTSAHYGIEDQVVHQYVQDADIAWHAGDGSMNARSIGIEHSAQPGRDASQDTINTSAQLVADLCQKYAIPCDRQHIIKHSEVPYPTDCCGTVPIDTIVRLANNIIADSQEGEDDMASPQVEDLKNHIMLLEGLVTQVLKNQGLDDTKIEDLKAHVMNVETQESDK